MERYLIAFNKVGLILKLLILVSFVEVELDDMIIDEY